MARSGKLPVHMRRGRGSWESGAYSDDRTDIPGLRTVSWTWNHIEEFIDSL